MRALAYAMLIAGLAAAFFGGWWMGWELAGAWLALALGFLFFGLLLAPVAVVLDRWELL